MKDHDHDLPRWIPYSAPPADGWDRTRDFTRPLLFPLMLVLFALGVWGALSWASQTESGAPGRTEVNVNPPLGSDVSSDSSGAAAQLTIQSQPDGASVWINGDSVGATPLTEHSLSPGVYFLSLRSEGYFNADTVAIFSEGTAPSLTFDLQLRPTRSTSPAAAEAGGEDVQPSEPQAAQDEEGEGAPDTTEEEESLVASQSSSPDTQEASSSSTEEAPQVASSSPPTGSLRILSSPGEANVVIDETSRGQTPLTLDQLSPGSHLVRLEREGHESWTGTVLVEAEETQVIHETLDPLTGQLRVLAQPWGTIFVDDSLHARESDIWYETELPVGEHRVRVVHPSLGEEVRTVEVQAEGENEVVIDLRGEPEA